MFDADALWLVGPIVGLGGSAVSFRVTAAGWWGCALSLAVLGLVCCGIGVAGVPSWTSGPGCRRGRGVGGVIMTGGGQRVVVTANEWGKCCYILCPCVGMGVAVEPMGAIVDS